MRMLATKSADQSLVFLLNGNIFELHSHSTAHIHFLRLQSLPVPKLHHLSTDLRPLDKLQDQRRPAAPVLTSVDDTAADKFYLRPLFIWKAKADHGHLQ